MGEIRRQVMRFIVPLSTGAIASPALGGRFSDREDNLVEFGQQGKKERGTRAVIPLYVNPTDITIQDKKLINTELTKGGFVVQYWGEDLTKIQVNGTTASSGIEGINILRDVYRHEQIQFEKEILKRASQFEREAARALEDSSSATANSGLVSGLDTLLDGAISEISDGISSTIDAITDAFNGTTEEVQTTELIPTLAAFATSIIMEFQGERFKGYFDDFQVSENAATPGHFNYSFNFVVTRKSGRRSNFMPWHRRPTDLNGVPIPASIPVEGPRLDELSFSSDIDDLNNGFAQVVGSRTVTSTFTPASDAQDVDINNVGVNRNLSTKR